MTWMIAAGLLAWTCFKYMHIRGFRVTLSLTLMVLFQLAFMILAFGMGMGLSIIFLGVDVAPNNSWSTPHFYLQSIEPLMVDKRVWPIVFLVPILLPIDILRWMIHVSIHHGNIVLWICEILAAGKCLQGWIVFIRSYRQAMT